MTEYLGLVAKSMSPTGSNLVAVCSSDEETTATNQQMTGTVTNKNIGSGKITNLCDTKTTMTSSFTHTITVAGGRPTSKHDGFRMGMSGYQACAWAMSYTDSARSKLSGTIEMTYSFSSDSAEVACPAGMPTSSATQKVYCVPFTSSADIFIVGGTGYFAGTTGTGSFVETQVVPMMIPLMGDSSGVQGASAASVRVASLASGVLARLPMADTAATGSSMKMALLKGKKSTVRLVSPAKVSGQRSLGVGPDGATQLKVKVSAAPGAKCSVKAASKGKSVTLVKPKTDSDGLVSTSVTSKTVRSKLSLKTGASAILSVYCASGKSTATSKAAVTLDG